jgi:anti-sigma factor RsiW
MQAQPDPPDEGIRHAKTREGFDLPVIDVTHPRFTVPDDLDVRALHEAFERERRLRRIPKFITRLMLRAAARKSRLIRALFTPQAEFLDGMTTYVMKLGADNLVPPYDTPMDRRLAASPHILIMRLRMQQTAQLIADGIAEDLAAAAGAPLALINIGGGPPLDSINALILLRRARPGLLNRPIAIDVLDCSQDGAFFGANALAALTADGGPLAGLDVAMRYHDYDWHNPAVLESRLQELIAAGAIVVASSEGALFEYGSDQAIVANLKVLGANGKGVRLVAGSVTRADETARAMLAETRFKLIPRGTAGFAPLAEQAGFRIARTLSTLLSDQVLLRPR